MGLVIKKRLSLAFLGKEYADSFLLLSAISVGEYEVLDKSSKTVKDTVIDHFISGSIHQDGGNVDVTKDNIEELPGEVYVEAFKVMTGQLDPKDLGQLTSPSTTDNQPQTN
jgi:hypothetical protein